jgi:hypothetical protein
MKTGSEIFSLLFMSTLIYLKMLILDRIKSSPKNLPQSAQGSWASQFFTGAVKNSRDYFSLGAKIVRNILQVIFVF